MMHSRTALLMTVPMVALSVVLTACTSQPQQPASGSTASPEAGSGSPTMSPSPTTSASPSRSASSSSQGPVRQLAVQDWVTGLTTPWGLAFFRDGSALVSERDTGKILLIRGGKPQQVGTIDGFPSSEGGTLGVTIAKDQKTIFVYYSLRGKNRVSSYGWDGSSLGPEKVLLDKIPNAGIHNGGQLSLGPDGYLYVSTGDATDSTNAQDKQSLAGKILRITTDGKPAPGNPFGNEVWSFGHRNVQGLAFDDSGRLWASEFGDHTKDELNLIIRGHNYGWPKVEGVGDVAGMTNPVATWSTDEASPSGLAFWRGSLWMASLRGERLWQITPEGVGDHPEVAPPAAHFINRYGRLRAVQATPDGTALVLGTSNTDGRGDPRDGDDRLLRLTEKK